MNSTTEFLVRTDLGAMVGIRGSRWQLGERLLWGLANPSFAIRARSKVAQVRYRA